MTDWEKFDYKISKLYEKVDLAARPVIGPTTTDDWNKVFLLMNEIQEEFKTVRYPKKFDRDAAWKKFCEIRDDAYQSKRRQYINKSEEHYDTLYRMLNNAYYDWDADTVVKHVLWGAFKVTIDEMKRRGKLLSEARNLFKSVKQEMTKERKGEIHEKIVEVKESHDEFWQRVRDYREEQEKVWREKREACEERQERRQAAKDRIKDNLEKNRERLRNAESFLSRLESQRDGLQDKINSAYSDNYRERHEQWLSEKEDKIREVEKEIEKYEEWIREDKEKLDSWFE